MRYDEEFAPANPTNFSLQRRIELFMQITMNILDELKHTPLVKSVPALVEELKTLDQSDVSPAPCVVRCGQ